MRSLCVTVEATYEASQTTAFELIVPIDLASIFTGYGPLPAVTGTRHQTGAWDAIGQTRTVFLSDGSTAQEQLTGYDYPHSFRYTVSEFTGILRFLAASAEGQWWFSTPAGTSKTHIRWRYAFKARSVVATPVLWTIAHLLWRPYMNQALALAKSRIETRG